MPDYGGSGPWPVPRAAQRNDLDIVVRGFASSALRAAEAGFDGVEVHAANGYLLDQFITDYTNRREDEYGGDAAGRVRLTAEVVEAIRGATPASFVVGVRLSQTKVNDLDHRWSGVADEVNHRGGRGGRRRLRARRERGSVVVRHRRSGRRAHHHQARPRGHRPAGHRERRHARSRPGGPRDRPGSRRPRVDRDGALANPDLPRRVSRDLPLDAFDPAMIHPDVTLGAAKRLRRAV